MRDILKDLRGPLLTLLVTLILIALDPSKIYRIFHLLSPEDGARIATEGFLTPSNLIYLFLVLALTATFGHVILWRYWQAVRAPRSLQILGSFWAGYIATAGIFRILSYAIPRVQATQLMWLIMIGLLIWQFTQHKSLRRTSGPWLPTIRDNLLPTTASLALAVWIFVTLVYEGDWFWVGNGPTQYLWYATSYLRSDALTFPIMAQHCDELLYTIFLMAPLNFQYEPILAMAIVLTLNKVSTAIMIYLGLRHFNVTKWPALAFTGFFLFGSFGLNPLNYLLYFDSGNPIAYIAHSGRVVGLPLLFFFLVSTLRQLKGQEPLWSRLSLLLLGFGVITTSISNFVFAVILLTLAWLVRQAIEARTKANIQLSTPTQQFLMGAALLIFAGAALAYWPDFLRPTPAIRPGLTFLLTLFGGGTALAILLAPVRQELKLSSPNPEFKALKIFLLAAAPCALFFANLFVKNPLNEEWLSWLRETTHLSTFFISNPFAIQTGGVAEYGGPYLVDAREVGPHVQYSASTLHFCFSYGLILLLTLQSIWSLRRPSTQLGRFSTWLGLAMFFMLNLSFLYIDFVNDLPRSWLKTRFIEGPIYTLFFVWVIQLVESGRRRHVAFFAAAAAAWCLTPIINTQRVEQWVYNLEFLRSLF